MKRKIAIFWFLLAHSAMAQVEIGFFEWKADTQAIHVGEPVAFHVHVKGTFTAGDSIMLNLNTLKPFEILGKIDTTINRSAQGTDLQLRFMATCFDTGFHVLKPLEWITEADTFVSNPILMKVEMMNLADELLLYDIKDNIKIPRPWTDYLYAVLILFALIVLIYIIIKKILSQPKYELASHKVPLKKPWDAAWEQLMFIEAQSLWLKKGVKDYYVNLLDVLRRFLEDEKNLPAMESTYTELEAIISALHLPKDLDRDIKSLLLESELVKFAKSSPSAALCAAHLELAKRFLMHYKPTDNQDTKA